MEEFLRSVGIEIAVAAIFGVIGYLLRGVRYRQRVAAAPQQYVDRLEKMIRRAISEGDVRAATNARAIVGARDDMRDHMISMAELLNSEIDKLAAQLGMPTLEMPPRFGDSHRDSPGQSGGTSSKGANKKEMFETIAVLWRKWPSKRDQVEVEFRKLLAELGFDRA